MYLGTYSNHRRPSQVAHENPESHTFIEALPPPTSPSNWAVEEVTQKTKGKDNGTNVAAASQAGTARAVCDGSFKDEHGTAGFCIHGDDPMHQVEGCNRTPGTRADQSAHRSELGGVVGTLLILKSLCEVHNIQDGAVELGLDCESAIKKITAHYPQKSKTVTMT